jgi:hypothetical protein
MSVTYGSRDTDVDAWYNNIVANGGSVSNSVRYSVLTFSRNLKSSGLWSKLKEIYILCGVPDINSALTKLKYIDTQRITNVGFATADYTATGSTCGFKGDSTYKRLDPSVAYNAFPVKDRFVGAYETVRIGNFYDTVIGRERGGGNTAFGPTVNPDGHTQARILDVTTNAYTVGYSTPTTAGGLITANVTSSVVAHYANKTWQEASYTIGDTLGGTGGYVLGGAIGGGGFMKSTLSLGFMGNYLNQTETQLLSTYCDIFMTDMGGNK